MIIGLGLEDVVASPRNQSEKASFARALARLLAQSGRLLKELKPSRSSKISMLRTLGMLKSRFLKRLDTVGATLSQPRAEVEMTDSAETEVSEDLEMLMHMFHSSRMFHEKVVQFHQRFEAENAGGFDQPQQGWQQRQMKELMNLRNSLIVDRLIDSAELFRKLVIINTMKLLPEVQEFVSRLEKLKKEGCSTPDKILADCCDNRSIYKKYFGF
ncbi:unnamed protein product [Timema podura]|uniref:Uncharacterized protein n=1 Tax=Timema podura TaxID=61482 RepID=A0ABN7NFW7_TIMPD|nr:unnamed protein product [Timema podura]